MFYKSRKCSEPTWTSAHAHSVNTAVVVFGGWDVEIGQDNNQTWSWDGSNWVQLTPKKSPVAREGLGMAHDPATHESTMFGGQIVSTGRELRDTWKWNGR